MRGVGTKCAVCNSKYFFPPETNFLKTCSNDIKLGVHLCAGLIMALDGLESGRILGENLHISVTLLQRYILLGMRLT